MNHTQDQLSKDRNRTFKVTSEEEGKRLDRLLADRFPDFSRERWKRVIEEGEVKTGKKKVSSSYRPALGETIVCLLPEQQKDSHPQPEQIPLNVLYEDDWLAAIDKPAGMVVHPAHGHSSGTLVNAILHRYEKQLSADRDPVRPGIVHRLDRETSGVMIVVFDNNVRHAIQRLFRQHEVERIYDTIVWGDFEAPRAVIELPIARSDVNRKKMVVREDGKPAKTRIENIAGNGRITHLRCALVTGRTHQIRVHLAHIGYPVIGDTLYGGCRGGRKETGQLLHASLISFVHPITNEIMTFESPLDDRFKPYLDEIDAASGIRA